MNANELADKLENEVNMFDHPCASHAADMLRQLQAENEAFKFNLYNTGYSIQLRDKDETIRQQQTEIEALKAVLKEAINGMGHSHQAKFKEYLK